MGFYGEMTVRAHDREAPQRANQEAESEREASMKETRRYLRRRYRDQQGRLLTPERARKRPYLVPQVIVVDIPLVADKRPRWALVVSLGYALGDLGASFMS